MIEALNALVSGRMRVRAAAMAGLADIVLAAMGDPLSAAEAHGKDGLDHGPSLRS
jgi:hypothetical protein